MEKKASIMEEVVHNKNHKIAIAHRDYIIKEQEKTIKMLNEYNQLNTEHTQQLEKRIFQLKIICWILILGGSVYFITKYLIPWVL